VRVPNELLPALAVTCECNQAVVSAVVDGLNISMRRDDRNAVIAKLTIDLEYCAAVYCGADALKNSDVLDEAIYFCISRFAQLGVGEIREAFSLAAAGDLGDIDLSAYHGRFTIKILGEVLKSYLDFREKVVRELRRAELEAAEAEREAEKRANMSEWSVKHEGWCKDKIAGWLAGELPTYDGIAVTIYDYLVETGELELTKEAKLALMERAKPLVVSSYTKDLNEETNEFRKRSIRNIIDNARRGELAGYFVGRQKLAAKQLAVLDYLTFQKSLNHADAA